VSRFYRLGLGLLSVWRVTHMLYGEDGPGDAFVHLRRKAGNGFWGGLLDCFYCLSVWVAAPFALLLGQDWKERLVLVPALSAGAILIERLAARPPSLPAAHTVPTAQYVEDEEVSDGVLRREEAATLPGRAEPAGE
jgi:hypothetical protein